MCIPAKADANEFIRSKLHDEREGVTYKRLMSEMGLSPQVARTILQEFLDESPEEAKNLLVYYCVDLLVKDSGEHEWHVVNDLRLADILKRDVEVKSKFVYQLLPHTNNTTMAIQPFEDKFESVIKGSNCYLDSTPEPASLPPVERKIVEEKPRAVKEPPKPRGISNFFSKSSNSTSEAKNSKGIKEENVAKKKSEPLKEVPKPVKIDPTPEPKIEPSTSKSSNKKKNVKETKKRKVARIESDSEEDDIFARDESEVEVEIPVKVEEPDEPPAVVVPLKKVVEKRVVAETYMDDEGYIHTVKKVKVEVKESEDVAPPKPVQKPVEKSPPKRQTGGRKKEAPANQRSITSFFKKS